jgi:hypothetical protein
LLMAVRALNEEAGRGHEDKVSVAGARVFFCLADNPRPAP